MWKNTTRKQICRRLPKSCERAVACSLAGNYRPSPQQLGHRQQAADKGLDLMQLSVWHLYEGLPIERVRDGQLLFAAHPLAKHCMQGWMGGTTRHCCRVNTQASELAAARLDVLTNPSPLDPLDCPNQPVTPGRPGRLLYGAVVRRSKSNTDF